MLFNRFFQPEIDIEKEVYYYPWELSNPKDYMMALRFAGLLYGNLDGSICVSRGIYNAEDVIKMILAGADAVQVVSTVYKNSPSVITDILTGLNQWMEEKEYKSLGDFRGKLSRKNMKDPFTYQRAQYVDILMKSEEIFKKYPTGIKIIVIAIKFEKQVQNGFCFFFVPCHMVIFQWKFVGQCNNLVVFYV